MKKLFINADIFTAENENFENGFLLIENEKIAAVGDMKDVPREDCEIIDCAGKYIYPGFIDAHCHLGMIEDSINFEGDDLNEMTNPVTPQLRAVDAVNPFDKCFDEARAAGITAVVTGPGSANPIGGQMAAIKLCGKSVDDMVIKAPVAMKLAFGENPKTVYNDRKQTPMTRMGSAALIRTALEKAKRYAEKTSPEYDAECEALLPVLKGEIPVHCHAHRADDIFTALRIAGEYNLKCVIIHCTEGYLIADEIKKSGAGVVLGPVLGDRCKPELGKMCLEGAGIISKNGIAPALCTDHPVIPLQYLTLCAALCAREGMPDTEALKSVTINAARVLGLEKRIGSIAAGKDADFGIFTGSALEVKTKCVSLYINGEKQF
ncbi:MAG: amidohydrolase [Candidatus Avelusimicrobium sp.]